MTFGIIPAKSQILAFKYHNTRQSIMVSIFLDYKLIQIINLRIKTAGFNLDV
jgi:hypothetical protein